MDPIQEEEAAVLFQSQDASAGASEDSSEMDELIHINNSSSSSSSTQEDRNAPHALIRQESTAIGAIRVFAASLLLIAAMATSFYAFQFSRNVELRSFQADFVSSADRLTGTFISEYALRFTMTKTLSAAVTAAMEAQKVPPTNFSFGPGRMAALSSGILLAARGTGTSWSPFLRTEEERLEFEAFVQFKEESQQIIRCYLCGSPTQHYANPKDYTFIPGYGSFTCREVELAGLDGVITPQFCSLVASTVGPSCSCIEMTEDEKQQAQVVLEQVTYPDRIFDFDKNGMQVDSPPGSGPYSPIWEVGSAGGRKFPFLYNAYSDPGVARTINLVLQGDVPVLSEIFYRNSSAYKVFARTSIGAPAAMLYGPVYSPDGLEIVGTIATEFPWGLLFKSVEAFANVPMLVVIANTCGQEISFLPDFVDDSMKFIGAGDLHDHRYKNMVKTSSYEEFETVVNFGSRLARNQTEIEYCRYMIRVYPTREHELTFLTQKPVYYSIGSVLIFLFSSVVFGVYDWLVDRRQRITMSSAVKSNNIVSALFPENVRERLYEQAMQAAEGKLGRRSKVKMENFADGAGDVGLAGEPIADLFPSATVMHFDIQNFTVWSSEREPSAMFTLLEAVYGEFDKIAKKMGVFKVETVGDSYVAVCGLPKKNDNHAVIMARFAALCVSTFAKLTRRLEVSLGPSTGDLHARVGLHSGPVVAGVLRGDKARFQLFGDTVNVTTRLQTSCKPMCIHASKTTAALVSIAGYADWLQEREADTRHKGMTSLQTYWVKPTKSAYSECSSVSGSVSGSVVIDTDAIVKSKSSDSRKLQRLVDWNVEVLYELLQNLAADRNRNVTPHKQEPWSTPLKDGAIVVDELVTVLSMPAFDEERVSRRKKMNSVKLPFGVRTQLHKFVSQIAETYRDVPFHNFEHASHVVMSARKLMKRVIEPDNVDYEKTDAERKIHEATYGISSDPLLLFTVVFSALIHDADHTGLSNAELIAKKDSLAQIYMERSVAEQNSVDMAWRILNEDCYADFRACIYSNEEELLRFRQLLVNAVIATDIADKTLKGLRETRWDAAFAHTNGDEGTPLNKEDSDRRATVIYEYIIQAADISHTMQHWHTYIKFNKRLFEERYLAWINGHAPKEPSDGWYGGELWFFDNYIIPLAKKLNQCGVFGVSYDEFLTYALENRREWEEKGKDIVPVFLKSCQAQFGTEPVNEPTKLTVSRRMLQRLESGVKERLLV